MTNALRKALQESIAWALTTFPDETIEQQALHLAEEARELEAAPADPEEMADVAMLAALVLYRAEQHAEAQGVDLAEAARHKLTINRSRTWRRSAGGVYYREVPVPAPQPEDAGSCYMEDETRAVYKPDPEDSSGRCIPACDSGHVAGCAKAAPQPSEPRRAVGVGVACSCDDAGSLGPCAACEGE